MRNSDVQSINLPPDMVLSVTSIAGSVGSLEQLSNSAGGPSQSTTAISGAGVLELGPYTTPTRWRLRCTGADITYSVDSPTQATNVRVLQATLTPASVAAAVCAEQAFTVVGVNASDKVAAVSGNTGNATGIAGARVTAADQVTVRFVNPTAGALVPGAGVYSFLVAR